MHGIREFLETVRDRNLDGGHFRGLLHVCIGRRITKDNEVVSVGQTWRELAGLLKELKFDRERVREFGADPEVLAQRDRERFWYSAIALAHVDTAEAVADAVPLVKSLEELGYAIGAGPSVPPPAPGRTGKSPSESPLGKKKRPS